MITAGINGRIKKVLGRVPILPSYPSNGCTALALVESQRLLLTEEQLNEYQNAANMLYFPAPSVFEMSSDGFSLLDDKISRFGSGKLTSRQLLDDLEIIATMLRYETNN